MELLSSHPNHIFCELGVSHDIFVALISDLQDMVHNNYKYMSLEEQFQAIFFSMFV
jgi:hypothetical protein